MLKEYNVDVVKAFAPGGCLRYNALPTVLLRYYSHNGVITEIDKIENRTYTYLRRDREWIFFLLDYDTGAYQLDYQFIYQSRGDMLTAIRLCQPIQ